ncbi:hypothetical protein ACFYM0_10975 [Streptomyces sp. NPDC006487]|uniref:hypothetical protein n=1 Tax=Streptomyces sp. NPDC006487 TaxID=3364748 RepID=UPI0036B6B0CC
MIAGVCMGLDAIRPSLAVHKEPGLRSAAGYTPLEFRDALHALADGVLEAEIY